jgi:hypothetical protein
MEREPAWFDASHARGHFSSLSHPVANSPFRAADDRCTHHAVARHDPPRELVLDVDSGCRANALTPRSVVT